MIGFVVTAHLAFGIPLDPEGEDRYYFPWQLNEDGEVVDDDEEKEPDDVYAEAKGWLVDRSYVTREYDPEPGKTVHYKAPDHEKMKTVPVEFDYRGSSDYGSVIAIVKESSTRCELWDIKNVSTVREVLVDWIAQLNDYLDVIGIPQEHRGEPGWYLYASYSY